MWYDINKTLSHNCLLNFVVGQRGVGKTYAFKRRAINNFLRKGEQFVYLRRYDTEVKASMMEKFFSDIMVEFPDTDFGVSHGKFYIDSHVAGYYIPLSKSAQYKSVPFPDVTLIAFDEFIIDQGLIRYLPNEVVTFNEMYSTIARLRDVPVLFLSNAITFTNPYFLFFDLKLQRGQKIVKKGDILLELVENPDYTEAAQQTRFGKIISNTEYGRYAINNEFLRDNEGIIVSQEFIVDCVPAIFGVHSCLSNLNWYVSESVDRTSHKRYAMDTDSHAEGTVLKQDSNAKVYLNMLLLKYMEGNLRFTTMKAKNIIVKLLRRSV